MKVIKAKYQHIMEKSPILKIERIARVKGDKYVWCKRFSF